MTTDTRDNFAGHSCKPATHQGQSFASRVQWLDRYGRIGGYTKMNRPVCLDGHCPEDSFHVPWAIEAYAVRLTSETVKGELIADQPE